MKFHANVLGTTSTSYKCHQTRCISSNSSGDETTISDTAVCQQLFAGALTRGSPGRCGFTKADNVEKKDDVIPKCIIQ